MYGYLADPKNVHARVALRLYRRFVWFVVWPSVAAVVVTLAVTWWGVIAPFETTGELVGCGALLVLFAISVFLILEMIVSIFAAHATLGDHFKAGTIRRIDYRIRNLRTRQEGEDLVPVTDDLRFNLQRLQDEHFEYLRRQGGYRDGR